MRKLLVVTLLVVISSVSVHGDKLSATERATVIQEHNKYRAAENAGNKIPDITYDSDLEKLADAWISTCHYAHQHNNSFGENLGLSTSRSDSSTIIRSLIKLWVDEKQFNPGRTFEECCSLTVSKCCHYTQVIWAKSTKVGCALKRCASVPEAPGFHNAFNFGCYYRKPGNSPALVNCGFRNGDYDCDYDWRPY